MIVRFLRSLPTTAESAQPRIPTLVTRPSFARSKGGVWERDYTLNDVYPTTWDGRFVARLLRTKRTDGMDYMINKIEMMSEARKYSS